MIPEATILDIQRMSTEDGPGLRTTVFFKGCSLCCSWCHNPESIDPRPVIQWHGTKCIGCDSCRSICQTGALIHLEEGISVDHEKCERCLTCISECPSGALSVRGERYEGTKLLQELLKDKAYFGKDGGITLSGGEPLLQKEFAVWLLQELNKHGVHTALDTCGMVRPDSLLEALDFSDLLLYDIKLIDAELHKKYTGAGNKQVLENLKKAVPIIREKGIKLWIRTPIIPDATDSIENVAAIATFIKRHLEGLVERWELCAFNNLCLNKYQLLGQIWPYKDAPLMSGTAMAWLTGAAKKVMQDENFEVLWTGSVQGEGEAK